MGIIIAIGVILSIVLIGLPILILGVISLVVMPIIAVVKIADGVDYSYPITGNFLRRSNF